MSINFQVFNSNDANYLKVIDLYKEAFPGAQRIPTFVLRYKLRNGPKGFNVLYENDKWVGLIYCTHYQDIVFVQFLAIAGQFRSKGYGSKVMNTMSGMYPTKRIVLNIEQIDTRAKNYQQRVKRKAFYEKNGFTSTGFLVAEPGEMHEMLIRGGSINQEEIESMYKSLFGKFLGFFIRPKVIKI
ncbi:GNAT family N-acetyltransferase [Pseudoalteromonas sp. MMG022]|uniref:GNAT family N-acetyltransferase n=1 Tax=Pseudoalteromonas sp. MMG022 TaxID=2909978 RepID=UPI001F38A421|nr:GNAT family N-acetyltransferase [Pseudoalteromonas sp. MMG022]MCF6437600.1 GNAT family N-acetyltransferase [Pseudoalteromonas sp. MMG022]